MLGWVIRWTIGSGSVDWYNVFQESVGVIDFSNALSVSGNRTGLDPHGFQLSHRIMHLEVDEDFRGWRFKFASQRACEMVMRACAEDVDARCKRFIATCKDSIFAALRGQVFEAYAHRVLAACKELKGVRDLVTHELFQISLGDRERVNFDCLAQMKNKEEYGVPNAANFPVLDFVAPPSTAFQMTVSNSHPCVGSGATQMVDAGFTTLVFVVPHAHAKDFKPQPFLTLKGAVLKKTTTQMKKIRQAVYGLPLD